VSCPELVAGAFVVYGLADLSADAPKYEPLDWIEVTNLDSAAAVRLILDHGDSFRVPAGAIRQIESHPYRVVQIRNEGATTIAAGLVSFLAQREPIKVDSYIRRFKL
jgi:hypothetical protein